MNASVAAVQPTVRSRFHDAFAGRLPGDRLPMLEWAMWWNQTIARWRGEGLPAALPDAGLKAHFGLDQDHQLWVEQIPAGLPRQAGCGEGHGAGWIADGAGYEAVRGRVYRQDTPFAGAERAAWAAQAEAQRRGERLLWCTVNGFFWWPRKLLGIEGHLYALGDQPELIARINQDQADFILRWLDQVCAVAVPDFLTLAEDMSYNHGPMLSERMFARLLAPYYRQVVPAMQARGIRVVVDSDGDVTRLAPWLEAVGVEGILPIERQAGCDIERLQAAHPRLAFIGHFDKMTMPLGEAAMRAEFERLLPAMRRGRFIPSVDHQTPPGVSLELYRVYLRLFAEYAARACAR
jgi:hypothetical protein